MERAARILLAGGGTGGHVYPAIAIADALRRLAPETALAFAGTTDRLEWSAVPRAGYPIYPISAAGIQRRFTFRNATAPFKTALGLKQSWQLVADFDADVVVGTGGYVSGPVGLASALRRRPLVLQEQNAYAGATNRLLGRFAEQVHIAFPEAEAAFPAGKTRLHGNPTRPSLATGERADGRRAFQLDADVPVLLVFGGSMGSQAINEAVRRGVGALLEASSIHVIWQTGDRYHERMQSAVTPHPRLQLHRYLDRMDQAYAACDLALCRAGASTCSELLVTGTPAILVPSPNVAEDHQTHNARSLVAAGAARMLPEGELASRWTALVAEVLADDPARRAMRSAALERARPDAADLIARDVLELAEGRHA